jgi:cell division transport system ATP-binding protein
MVGEPALLLADEPTGNLDPERTEEVMDLLQAGNARGTTVVVATHDRALIARHQKRVILLEHGRMVGGWPTPGKAVTG